MPEAETNIPVVEEDLNIETRSVPKARVRIETRTDVVEELVKARLATSSVEVSRVPIDREIDRAPQIRVEDGVTIIPVVEEILVVEKRLILKEELHIKRLTASDSVEVSVPLRKQRAVISRSENEIATNPERNMHMANEYSTTTEHYGNRTLTALFDDRADAEEAVARLRDLGIVETSIRLVGGEEYQGADRNYEKGFWESLSDFFFPEDDRALYAEGLRRGGYMVTVNNVRPDHYDDALEILDDEGSINLDERESAWRSEGWSGNTARADFMPVPGDSGMAPVATESGRATLASDRLSDTAANRTGDSVIPVVEEELRVGKRDVDLGRVRVRSYVVEEPVSKDVNLREDRVSIERRPVDRPLGAGEAAFADKTIEAVEHTEEPIISKNARVKEEIALHRDSRERTETVSDTVRRTEVEVEDERAKRPAAKTTRRKA